MFNVKTPKRIYYLVADNEIDMNKWVDAVCQVCGLKAYTQDEEQQCQSTYKLISICSLIIYKIFKCFSLKLKNHPQYLQ